MKQLQQSIQIIILALISGLTLWSCSFTNNTSGSKQFAKKHYNHGIVKKKSSKKDKVSTEEIAQVAEEKVTKKQKKEEIAEQVAAFVDAEGLTATSEDGTLVYDEDAMQNSLQEKIIEGKKKLQETKDNATTGKEIRAADKKLKRLERLERFTNKFSERFASKHITPGPEAASNSAAADKGTLGLIGGIFGILAFAFAVIPFVGFLTIPLAITAIILGAIGLNSSNHGWAIAGLILGILAIVLLILAIAVLLALFGI